MERATDIGVAHLQEACASRTPIRPIASSNSLVLATPTAAMLDLKGAVFACETPVSEVADAGGMPDQLTVCAGSLNIRSVPAAQGGVITWLMVGASVTVYDVSDGWGRITANDNDQSEWVNMKYLCR